MKLKSQSVVEYMITLAAVIGAIVFMAGRLRGAFQSRLNTVKGYVASEAAK